MDERVYLALDMGSSGLKCALLTSGAVLGERRERMPDAALPNGRYELDADMYAARAMRLLEDMRPARCDGLLISTQMHGYVLADERFCAVSPYVSWQDRFALQPGGGGMTSLDYLQKRLAGVDCASTGVPLKANLALCSLFARTQCGYQPPAGARLCTLGGFLIGKLTGAHVCHITNAAPTGLCDVTRGAWRTDILQIAGLSSLTLPAIARALAPVGMWRGVPVYPDVGDQQACLAGAKAAGEGCLHVNIGTAGLLGALTASFGVGAYENRPWLDSGLFLRTVSGLPGGREVAALRAQYPGDDEEVYGLLANSPDARASALYAQMADAYRAAAERMGVRVSAVVFSGGCVQKNPALRAAMLRALGVSADSAEDCGIFQGMRGLIGRLARGLRQ